MNNQKIHDLLNKLMNIEFESHYHYMQAAAWASYRNFDGCSKFLLDHAKEEHSHVRKLLEYINDLGANAIFSDLPKPNVESNTVEDLFASIYQREVDVTKAYDDAIVCVLNEKDNQTLSFLQWFVNEQHEEMTLCRRILDIINLIGSGPHTHYLIDIEIGKMTQSR
ncbi:MAG: ferroxidase [Candidatus Liberibacter europaeus]|uniref:Ferritin n=1 Tax=Candidatus Liberibacter europaeus TaxID=744859 RepID=A0A2T4VXK8_9HYPH|nr:ferroxidase [Candidatus Liberibacter europaeus]PTL86501.1 MAG: ferroxidase [Candidatus Liberibacter europaeus]